MIIVDTNVLSEVMLPSPSRLVQGWMATHGGGEGSWTTAVSLAEIRYGIERLPGGRRKALLAAGADQVFAGFDDRVLPFDDVAAFHYAVIASARDDVGRPIGPVDAQIAAICRAHGAALATRNVKDFEELGLELVDPWSD